MQPLAIANASVCISHCKRLLWPVRYAAFFARLLNGTELIFLLVCRTNRILPQLFSPYLQSIKKHRRRTICEQTLFRQQVTINNKLRKFSNLRMLFFVKIHKIATKIADYVICLCLFGLFYLSLWRVNYPCTHIA